MAASSVPPLESSRSDAELLSAIQAGDRDALSALLQRYAPTVHRFSLRMCHNPEDASDVLQDTLLAAARGVKDFRGGSSLPTWLFAIARSFCIKNRRRARAEAASTCADEEAVMQIASPLPSPDQAASDHEIGAALERTIAELEPAHREVLLLRDVEGLTAPEVADVLGISTEAVKSRLHRARVAVKDKLSPLLLPDAAARDPQCPDVLPMLSRYLEGEIGPAACAEMDRHVASCARCRADCDSLRRVLSLCKKEAQSGSVPPDVQLAVQKALREIGARLG